MKVIVAGATGFIGGETLTHCLAHPSITSILVVARHELSKALSADPKITTIIHADFSSWPEAVLEQLAKADACLWSIGGMNAKFPDAATARKVNVDFTLAAASAFAKTLVPPAMAEGSRFRFVYCSGWATENDLQKPLRFMRDSRRIKGEVENGLLALSERYPAFETLMVRPAGVLPKKTSLLGLVLGLGPCVRVDAVAAVMVEMCVHGSQKVTVENDELVSRGKELLEK